MTEVCQATKKARMYFFLQLPVTAELRHCEPGDIPSHKDTTKLLVTPMLLLSKVFHQIEELAAF